MSVRLFDLTGKRALVTGSTQGIGYGLARGLGEAGAELVINGRDIEKLTEAAANLRALGLTVHELSFDVTDQDDVQSAINEFESQTGDIDILVNNAGTQFRADLQDFPADQFDRLMKTNLYSVFYVAQTVARHMIKRKAGKIVNICSVQTALARPGIAPYAATKGAVANLTKGMATDWAQHGLQCNGLAPGYIDTPLNANIVNSPEFTKFLINRTPAGRWGQVEDLVGACIFLSSEASNFVNGTTLFVDGGITACM